MIYAFTFKKFLCRFTDMSEVFVTESSAKQKPKPKGKAALKAALRGDNPENLREAINDFKSTPQFKQVDLISIFIFK